MSPSKISIGWKTIACPSCGEMVTVSGATWGDEPEHLTVQCDWCKKFIALVRDLIGTVEREKAAIGVLISMEEPTKPMQTEAACAGFFESKTWGKKYPKIQLLTIAEPLAGKSADLPPLRYLGATFKKAEKFKAKDGEQLKIGE